jgi:hypothetical protein
MDRTTHENEMAFHASAARAHHEMSKCEDVSDEQRDFHKAMADAHTASGEYHSKCAAAIKIGKAAGMSDGDAIRPDGISVVVGDAPSIRPVLRYGQREFGKLSDGIDPELAKTIGISED